jgi:hypothetical protein
MKPASLVDSALAVTFDKGTENGRHPESFDDFATPADLDMAFAKAEACPRVDLDDSLDRATNAMARRNVAAACELVEVSHAVNRLRRSREIQYLIPCEVLRYFKLTVQSLTGHKRKSEELVE